MTLASVSGYNIHRSLSDTFEDYDKINTSLILTTDSTDADLLPDTEYFYIVYAIDGRGRRESLV